MPSVEGWLTVIEESGLAAAVREGTWTYPIVEIVHVLGMVVLVGCAFTFDLRLLGLARSLPVTKLAGFVLPWARASMLVAVPTGLLLFAAEATALAGNTAFRLKLILILAAGVNAAVFHRYTLPSVPDWDREVGTPGAARLAGAASLLLWTGVITCGQLIAYL